jgi:hypothetical protein
MKQILFVLASLCCVCVLSYCSGSKKASGTNAAAPTVTYTYETNVKNLVVQKCNPCHIPANGGRKLALDNYDSVKVHIDEIVRRVQLNPGEKGFMPFKNPKLSDSAIQVFKTWKEEGFTK